MGENIGREPGDWQRMLVERTRTRAEEERVKTSRAEERVRWPGGRRRERAEKQKSRRGGGGELMKQKAGLFLL